MAVSYNEARERFPAGLCQPEHGYRFGEEALLLAALGANFMPRAKNVVELGAGCGASLLGCLLLLENAQGLGIDREAELVDCARKNAALLGLPAAFHCRDLGDKKARPVELAGKFDLALANPPWRAASAGRPSPDAMRNRALRFQNDCLGDFFAAARFFLRHKGQFCLLMAAGGIAAAFETSRKTGFGLRFLLPIKTPSRNGRCERAFLSCRAGSRDDLQILDPLVAKARRDGASGQLWPDRALELTEMM